MLRPSQLTPEINHNLMRLIAEQHSSIMNSLKAANGQQWNDLSAQACLLATIRSANHLRELLRNTQLELRDTTGSRHHELELQEKLLCKILNDAQKQQQLQTLVPNDTHVITHTVTKSVSSLCDYQKPIQKSRRSVRDAAQENHGNRPLTEDFYRMIDTTQGCAQIFKDGYTRSMVEMLASRKIAHLSEVIRAGCANSLDDFINELIKNKGIDEYEVNYIRKIWRYAKNNPRIKNAVNQ